MKTLELFGKEKSVVTRERMRKQYSGFEYLLSKVLAEFPLDAAFSAAFAAVLKWRTGLRCSMEILCATYSLMTVAGASLGFAVGSLTSNAESARVLGFPIMVLLMVVGIINPSGVDNEPDPTFIRWLKLASPIKWAIEALCIAEYKGMDFAPGKRRWLGIFKVFENPRMGAYALVRNGDQVLDAIGLTGATYESHIKSLATLTGINLLISLFGLTFCGPKFKQAVGDSDDRVDLEVDADFSEAVPEDIREEINEMTKNAMSKSSILELKKVVTLRGPM